MPPILNRLGGFYCLQLLIRGWENMKIMLEGLHIKHYVQDGSVAK